MAGARRIVLGLAVMGVSALSALGQVVQTGTSLNVQSLQTGVVLSVRPAVSADGRYVGMAINPQFSTLDGVDTFIVRNPTNGIAPGTTIAAGMRRLPYRPAEVNGEGGVKVTFVDTDKPLLAAKLAAMDLKGVSLKEAVKKLADTTKQNVVLGIRGFEQAGVDVNVKRDFSLPAGTMKDALIKVLEQGAAGQALVIISEDKVIQVMTEASDLRIITKTYYLQDLLTNVPRFVAAGTRLDELGAKKKKAVPVPGGDLKRSVDLSQGTWQASVKSGEGEGAVPAAKPVPRPNSTNILEVITETVRPEVWKNHGGKSDIYMVNNQVTVKAPASVHAVLDGPKTFNPNAVPMYIQYSK